WVVAEVERLIDRRRVGLETPPTRQLQGCLDPADEAELLLILEDIEHERDRRDDPELLLRPKLVGGEDLLESLLRRPDLAEIQQEHEPPIMPCAGDLGLGAG